jgi:hypothetical protein
VTVPQTRHPAHTGPSVTGAAPASTVTPESERPATADMPMRPVDSSAKQSAPGLAMSPAQPHPSGPSRLELVTVIALSFVVLAAGLALAGLAGTLLGA